LGNLTSTLQIFIDLKMYLEVRVCLIPSSQTVGTLFETPETWSEHSYNFAIFYTWKCIFYHWIYPLHWVYSMMAQFTKVVVEFAKHFCWKSFCQWNLVSTIFIGNLGTLLAHLNAALLMCVYTISNVVYMLPMLVIAIWKKYISKFLMKFCKW